MIKPISNTIHTRYEEVPGDFAMWLFITMELTVFALFFIGFAVSQRLNVEMFFAGKQTLHELSGLLCTIVLIISSYLVAVAVLKIREHKNKSTLVHLILAIIFGLSYCIIKLNEYSHLFAQGFDLSTNTFYTLYFFTTFFHFMHVLLGLTILGFMAYRASANYYINNDYKGFEAGASYWHMVDLVWVILFFLIYIIN